MNKWKILETKNTEQSISCSSENSLWTHYGSDDSDSDLYGWLQDGWKAGSDGWMQDGWMAGSSGWMQDGWRVGSSGWLQDGWKVGSSGWLQDGWHAGSGSYTGNDSIGNSGYSGYSSDNNYSSGRKTNHNTGVKKIRFPWISLIACLLMFFSNEKVVDAPTIFFGVIFIINFVRWVKQ